MKTAHTGTAVPLRTKKISRAEAAKKLAYQRDKESEMVRGIFRFHECEGAAMKFPFKKYKGDEVIHYNLMDGQEYTIPLAVARHLNKNGSYPVHAYALSESGASSVRVGHKVRRFSFQSLDFMDANDSIEPGFNDIVTIEKI